MIVLFPNKGGAMFKLSQLKRVSPFFCLALMLLVMNPVVSAQEKKPDLAKKYAAIVGDYEFDMTDAGMGVMAVSFYIEDGAFWSLPESSTEAAKMEPVEGKEFEFTVADPADGSTYEIKFVKDESGKYTECHVKNEVMGFDLIGTKIKKSP
jgi:hypothetical protein